ncbi:hypothetical protein BH11GEM1_BH11GEM1_27850 [soil metagenome]
MGSAAGHDNGRSLRQLDARPLAHHNAGLPIILARQEFQHIEPLRRPRPQRRHESLDGVVLGHKHVLLDQVLVDARGVAAQRQLCLDPRPVGLTRGHRRPVCRRCRRGHERRAWSRWPGWRSLGIAPRRAGGRGGGVCQAMVPPDGLSIDAGAAFDFPVRLAAVQQRFDGRTQMRLQDVHSFPSRVREGVGYRPAVGRLGLGAQSITRGGGVWGGHKWGSLGGRRGFRPVLTFYSDVETKRPGTYLRASVAAPPTYVPNYASTRGSDGSGVSSFAADRRVD